MAGSIGRFFLFIGIVMMMVYFATDLSESPVFTLFFAGLGLIILGIALIRKQHSPPTHSERFRLIRKLVRKEKKEEEKRS
jgi:uncharacterized membrane protein